MLDLGLFASGCDAITATLNIASDPSRRTFWLFFISSMLLLFLGLIFSQINRNSLKEQWADINRASLFKYWSNPSHLHDITLLFTNNFLKILIVIPLLGGHIAATIFCVSSLQELFGDAPKWQVSAGMVVFIYSVSFFVAEDLSRYLLHKAMHKLPILWRFHRTHHSATVLSPLTIYRVHPVEMLLYYLRSLIVFGAVTGMFVYLFQTKVDAYDILGVDLLGFIFNFMGANLRHSHFWFSFGVIENWFISPAQHQLHHSRANEHENKNFGTCLALWDKLGGSWISAKRYQNVEFGL